MGGLATSLLLSRGVPKDFFSSARSQLYYVMLAECQLTGVHDGLASVGCH